MIGEAHLMVRESGSGVTSGLKYLISEKGEPQEHIFT